MQMNRIDQVISAVRSEKTNSLNILHRPAGAESEVRGQDWKVRIPQTDAARAEITARSQQTLQRLEPCLEHIKLQIPGFRWNLNEPQWGPGMPNRAPHGYIGVKLQFGERKCDGPYKYGWREGQIDIAGQRVKIAAYDVCDDGDFTVEAIRLDGSILVVNSSKNSSIMGRAGEYIAALAAEGLEPNRHWWREDYAKQNGAKIRTSWVRPHPQVATP